MREKLCVAVCQMKKFQDKEHNLERAATMINEAADHGAQMVILPEIFNLPYENNQLEQFAEPFPGPSTKLLAALSKQRKIILVGGSISEKAGESTYNTSYVFDEFGVLIGKHRKMHLFDIDIPGKITANESSVLSAGNQLTIIDHAGIRFAIMICYDCRFPELARLAALQGAQILIIPAEFNLTTGEAHWEALMRIRAIDNQVFVIGASAARNPDLSYQSWGHSMVVNPWGQIQAQCSDQEDILYATLDLREIDRIRQEFPLLQHRRTDIYEVRLLPVQKPKNESV